MPERHSYEPGTPSWVDIGTDVEGAKQFYGALFGWDVQDAGPPEQTGGYGFFMKNGKMVAGYGPQMNPGPPFWSSYVSVEDVEAIASRAGELEATILAEPFDVMDSGRMAVLLSPEVTASLFGELAALFSADAVLKGRSLLAGKAGDRIASSNVTLIDDGRHPEGYASAPVDGEGVASRETVLIDRGVLRGFLQSAYTAARMGTSLTGNALRGDYCSRPHISRTNLYLRPTGVSAEQLLRGVSDGVWVMEVMGLHTINPVTGDFSLGASGLRIESGRLTAPVDRMAIAGNILELLGSVEAVADDLEFLVIGPGATVLLRNLAVSGQ